MIVYKLDEAANMLGCETSTLKRWCSEGRVGHYKPGDGMFLFAEKHINEFLTAHEVKRGGKAKQSKTQKRLVGNTMAGRSGACAQQESRPGKKVQPRRSLPTLREVAQ